LDRVTACLKKPADLDLLTAQLHPSGFDLARQEQALDYPSEL
jgi:hypothetical protein